MTIHPLANEEMAFHNATHRAVVTFADFTAAANTQSFNLTTQPVNSAAACEYAYLKTPFTSSDGALASLAVTLGYSGSANRFVTSYELLAAPVNVKGGVALNPDLNAYSAADNVIAAFTATAAHNVNTLTAGEIHFYLTLRNNLALS
jgi:hypothetical protein